MGRAVIVSAAMVLAAVACTGRGDPTPPSAVPTTADAFHVVVDTDLAYDDVVVDAVTIVGTGEEPRPLQAHLVPPSTWSGSP